MITVSICMITYNHAPYIAKAIEGILKQQTTFPIELIIGEDSSTDITRNICQEYQTKYPDIIRLLLHEVNIGMMQNFISTLQASTGKYIALCEGDDYWTNPLKLQKQVDFLEANEEYSICFHNANVYNENEQKIIYQQPGIKENRTFTIFDYLKNNPCPTASVLFNREYINPVPEWFSESPFGDYALYLLIISRSGKNAFYLNDAMAVYRIHSGGVHGNAVLSNKGMVGAYKQNFIFWDVMTKYLFKDIYKKEINNTFSSDYNNIINHLIADKRYLEAIKTNTVYMLKLNFKYFKNNIQNYIHLVKKLLKR